jgi:hypothetical protein
MGENSLNHPMGENSLNLVTLLSTQKAALAHTDNLDHIGIDVGGGLETQAYIKYI